MIRGWLATALAAALALIATSVAAQTERDTWLPLDGVITNPDWERRPTGEEMARYFPQLAQTFQLGGNAVIQCKVTVAGAVEGCRPLSESPAGFGFGVAAVRLSSVFKMKPRLVDGQPVGGATVNIPIAFRVSAQGDPPPLAAAPAPSVTPTPESLALARRLVAARRLVDGYNLTFQRLGAQLSAVAANAPAAADRATSRALAADLQRAIVDYVPTYLEDQAAAYASRLTADELTQIVAFFESPVGRTWTGAAAASEADVMRRAGLAVTKAAGEAFCAQGACPQGPPPAARPAPAGPTALPIER